MPEQPPVFISVEAAGKWFKDHMDKPTRVIAVNKRGMRREFSTFAEVVEFINSKKFK